MHLNWKYIILLNAGDQSSSYLIWLLNDAGLPVAIVGQEDMKTYTWPERKSLKPRINGFLMMVGANANLTEILRYLQQEHMISGKRPWILGIEHPLCLTKILKEFDEGDRVLILGGKVGDSKLLCKDETSRSSNTNEEDTFEDIKMWTLRSPGNGSIYFEQLVFWNFSNVNYLFDTPFRNFRNRTLKISSLASPPIIMPPKSGEQRSRGYIFRIINTLGDIFNFTYTVKEADGRLYGMEQEDGSWSGMIGELTKKSVDLGAGDLSWALDRSLVVDLTTPVFPETVTFIYRAPEFYSRTWILFQGIEPKVWIAMMSTTVAAFAAYFLSLSLHRVWNHLVKDPAVTCVETADESISSLYRALLGKGVMNVPFPISCRTVLGIWFIGALVLSALYGGSLTSKLSLHKSPKPADSLHDLLKRHPHAVLALRNNSQIHQFFKESSFWHHVWLKNMEKYVIPGHLHIADTMVKVHNSHDERAPYVWIAERSMLVKMMHNYSNDPIVCDLYVAKESIVRSDWSLALQRDSPFIVQFNDMITRMQQYGLLERWRRQYWESEPGTCHPTDGFNQSGETPITLSDTVAIFIVLAVGWGVGILVLIIERRIFTPSNT